MFSKPLLYVLIAGTAVVLAVGLGIWFQWRKKRKQFQEVSHLQRRNEVLNEALRNPQRKGASSGPEGPMSITWDDKAVKKGDSSLSLMIELVELSDYSRRKYVFRAGPPIAIGSGEGNQIVLSRDGVAAQHCEICLNGNQPCVKSAPNTRTILKRGKTAVLVSPDGVYLNNGDQIEIGSAQIQFRMFKG